MKRSFLALIIACSQLLGQDRDLPGYTLAFEDNFDTLSVGPDTDKGSATWGNWPPYGPAGAFSRSQLLTLLESAPVGKAGRWPLPQRGFVL